MKIVLLCVRRGLCKLFSNFLPFASVYLFCPVFTFSKPYLWAIMVPNGCNHRKSCRIMYRKVWIVWLPPSLVISVDPHFALSLIVWRWSVVHYGCEHSGFVANHYQHTVYEHPPNKCTQLSYNNVMCCHICVNLSHA